jgi:hypothetical protein
LNINWNPSNGETWNNYINGWLPTEGIQAIVNVINQITILIYLESGAVQMFFSKLFDSFFIKKDDSESFTFKQEFKRREINVEMFKKAFNDDSLNLELTIIDFLQFLFNLPGVIGMLSSGEE